jgi:hypothetical protein
MIVEFGDDGENEDDRYLRWLADHPGGFVLNCYKNPTPSYLILHRATCPRISGTPSNGRSWTHDYRKVCADTETELVEWTAAIGAPRHCCMWGPCRDEWSNP